MPERDDRLERELLRLRDRVHDHTGRLAAMELLHEQTARDLAETVAIVKRLAEESTRSVIVADRDRRQRDFVLSLPQKAALFVIAVGTAATMLLRLLGVEGL